jgi:hypothetical protein
MDYCWNCGQSTEPGQNRCSRCNADLSGTQGNFIRCSNGHIVTEGSQFCPWCGESVSQIANVSYMSADSPPSSPQRQTIRLPRPSEVRTVIYRSGDQTAEAGLPILAGFLVSFELSKQGSFFPIREGRQSIGKGAAMRIRIDDDSLSEEHAVIVYRKGQFFFEDKLSTNGSEINGQEANGQKSIKHGDILHLGSYNYVFVVIPNQTFVTEKP